MGSPVAKQKEPSIYSVLAIAQSMAWMFVLPVIFRPVWPYIFENFSSQLLKEMILNQTATITFIIYTLFMLPIYYIQHPFFEQFKIVKHKKWPWLEDNIDKRNEYWKIVRKSAKLCTFNLLILVPLGTMAKYYITTTILGMEPTSFHEEDWPTYIQLIRDNTLMTIIHEFLFHSAHRLMHTYPSLYKYHKVHHEYKTNVVQAAQHNHPIDYILSIAAPVIVTIAIIQPHSFTIFQWAIYLLYTNLDDHIGYSFPFSPVRWFPFAATTEEHEFHHGVNIGCFSSKLDVFERLFGTNDKYLKWEKKQMDSTSSRSCVSSRSSSDADVNDASIKNKSL